MPFVERPPIFSGTDRVLASGDVNSSALLRNLPKIERMVAKVSSPVDISQLGKTGVGRVLQIPADDASFLVADAYLSGVIRHPNGEGNIQQNGNGILDANALGAATLLCDVYLGSDQFTHGEGGNMPWQQIAEIVMTDLSPDHPLRASIILDSQNHTIFSAFEDRACALKAQYKGIVKYKSEGDFPQGAIFLLRAVRSHSQIVAAFTKKDLEVLGESLDGNNSVQVPTTEQLMELYLTTQALFKNEDDGKAMRLKYIAAIQEVVLIEAIMQQSLRNIRSPDVKAFEVRNVRRALARVLRHMGNPQEAEDVQFANLGELAEATLGHLISSK